MNQPQNDNATVSREQAIRLARESAFAHSHQHSYLPQTREEADRWQPHEWVLLALQAGQLPSAPGIDRADLLGIINWWNAYTGSPDDALGEIVRRIRALTDASPKGNSDALDAARYRWLRDEAISFPYDVEMASPWCVFGMNTAGAVITPIDGTKLDAAIDAARRFAEDNEPQANSTEVGP